MLGAAEGPWGPCRDRTEVGGGSTPGAGTTAVQRDSKSDRGDWDNQGCSGGRLGWLYWVKVVS